MRNMIMSLFRRVGAIMIVNGITFAIIGCSVLGRTELQRTAILITGSLLSFAPDFFRRSDTKWDRQDGTAVFQRASLPQKILIHASLFTGIVLPFSFLIMVFLELIEMLPLPFSINFPLLGFVVGLFTPLLCRFLPIFILEKVDAKAV